jgi:hypothetical protein
VDAPALVSVWPNASKLVAAPATTLTGANLARVTEVYFGAKVVANRGQIVTRTETTLSVSPPNRATGGAVTITLCDGVWPDVTTAGPVYTYCPQPVITGITPSTGRSGISASERPPAATITGTYLEHIQQVAFDSQVATLVGAPTNTSVQLIPPYHMPGVVDAVVQDLYWGDIAVPAFYTYQLVLLPESGPDVTQTTVVIERTVYPTSLFFFRKLLSLFRTVPASVLMCSSAALPPSPPHLAQMPRLSRSPSAGSRLPRSAC